MAIPFVGRAYRIKLWSVLRLMVSVLLVVVGKPIMVLEEEVKWHDSGDGVIGRALIFSHLSSLGWRRLLVQIKYTVIISFYSTRRVNVATFSHFISLAVCLISHALQPAWPFRQSDLTDGIAVINIDSPSAIFRHNLTCSAFGSSSVSSSWL